jgi:cellobiose phosphorylase
MVAGKDAAKPGEGKNSWLTGTAAWNWYTITQFILGIKPTYDGIEIDPCIPETMKEYHVKRVLRDTEFDITVKNPEGRQSGVRRILVDGQPLQGTVVPADGGQHVVEVMM